MKLISEIAVRVKHGFLPHLTNEIYKRGCGTRKISLLESDRENDLFYFEIFYSVKDKFKGLIDKISKQPETFEIMSLKNILDDRLAGGMLSITGKLPLDNAVDYEINVLGSCELALDYIDKDEDVKKYIGITNNIALVNGINFDTDDLECYRLYTTSERDAIIFNKFSDINAFPLLVKIEQIDDFIKTLKSIEATYSSVRISYLDNDDQSAYTRIASELSIPVISQYYDEIPLNLIILIDSLFKKHNLVFKGCNAGLIGLNVSALRLTRLLSMLGFSRILGYDNNEKLMIDFEKEGGLATTQENIFSNSDVVIILKDQFSNEDLNKICSGQIIVSPFEEKIDNDLVLRRGVREVVYYNYHDMSVYLPGIIKGITENNFKIFDDKKILELAHYFISLHKVKNIPIDFFSNIHQEVAAYFKSEH